MAWKPARYTRINDDKFDIYCPYCGEHYLWERSKEKSYPDPQVCAECDRTYVIPVPVSRG